MARCLAQRMIFNLLSRYSIEQLQSSRNILQEFRKIHVPEKCIFSAQNRLLCKSTGDTSEDERSIYNLQNYDYFSIYKNVTQDITKILKKILNLTTADIHEILTVNPQLKKRSRLNLLNNHDNLLKFNIKKNTIIKNAWLLAFESNVLKEKLHCINQLKMNNDQLVPWLSLSQKELSNYVYYTQNDNCHNKIEYLADILKVRST